MSLVRTSVLLSAALALGVLSLHASLASAQVTAGRPERPERGLFKNPPVEDGDRLDLNGSVGAGLDDNILLDLPGVSDPRVPAKSGSIATASGGVSYNTTNSRGRLNASASSAARYYPGQPIEHVTSHGASLSGVALLTDRTSIYGAQSATYQPFTFSLMFPTSFSPSYDPESLPLIEATNPNFDQAATRTKYLSFLTTAGVSREFSKRTTFSASYHLDRSDTAYGTEPFTSQGASAGFRFSLTRGLGLRAGYGYQQAEYTLGAEPFRYHNIDLGVDYSKALSFSRRTKLSFSTGSSAINDGSNTRFRAIGGAQLNHEIGRTWDATISYDRSFEFVSTLLQPILYDALTAGVGGLVNRRVRVQTSAQASIGSIGIGDSTAVDNDFDMYQGNATLSFALSRFLDLGATYSIYRYRFGADAVLPPNVERNVDRQSVSVYLSVWAPVYSRTRRTNATR